MLGGESMDSRSRWKRTSVVEQKPLTLKQVIHLMAATKNEQISSFALLFCFFFLCVCVCGGGVLSSMWFI